MRFPSEALEEIANQNREGEFIGKRQIGKISDGFTMDEDGKEPPDSLADTRFPSDAIKEIASQGQEGKFQPPMQGVPW